MIVTVSCRFCLQSGPVTSIVHAAGGRCDTKQPLHPRQQMGLALAETMRCYDFQPEFAIIT